VDDLLGSPAVSERPVALRTGLAAGVPLSEGARSNGEKPAQHVPRVKPCVKALVKNSLHRHRPGWPGFLMVTAVPFRNVRSKGSGSSEPGQGPVSSLRNGTGTVSFFRTPSVRRNSGVWPMGDGDRGWNFKRHFCESPARCNWRGGGVTDSGAGVENRWRVSRRAPDDSALGPESLPAAAWVGKPERDLRT
jgi:hypothetical protein